VLSQQAGYFEGGMVPGRREHEALDLVGGLFHVPSDFVAEVRGATHGQHRYVESLGEVLTVLLCVDLVCSVQREHGV